MKAEPAKRYEDMDSITADDSTIQYRLDKEGKVVFVSHSVMKYGYSTDELIGKDIFEWIHPEDRKKALYRINERRTGNRSTYSFPVRLLTKKNALDPLEDRTMGVVNEQIFLITAEGLYETKKPQTDGFFGTQGIAKGIAYGKWKEDYVYQNTEVLKWVIESLPHPFCVIDASDYTIKLANFVDLSCTLSNKETCYELFQKNDLPCCSSESPCPIEKIKKTKQPVKIERVYYDKKENQKNVEIHVYPTFDSNGNVFQAIHYSIDITDRKQAERLVQESNEKYQRITQAITDYTYTVRIDNDHSVKTEHKPACVAVTGYTADEFMKNPLLWIQMVYEEDRAVVEEHAKHTLTGRKVEPLEHRIIHKDGSLRWVKNTPVQHFNQRGRLSSYDGLVQDITDRKHLENQLRQAQKLEALGTLAGGIAHNFNNLLMAIQGNTGLILLNTDTKDPNYEKLCDIQDAIRSGAGLTSQLLGFAKNGKFEVKPINLNELIKNQNRIFGNSKKEITVRGKYEENPWTVYVDKGQIEQVLLNLYVNAADAMVGGGSLYIQTRNIILDENDSHRYGIEPGKYVKVSVTDTGIGIDEEIIERIFDPFFTTKEMSHGSGLGLASVYGIIKNHNGRISVNSKKGEGSVFDFYIPASNKTIIQENHSNKEIINGHEAILLVDDEDIIIDIGKQMLKTMQYKVIIARSGTEAIKIYAEQKDKIDLVILDMIMPNMGGSETYDRLKKINSSVKILLSSGYSIEGQAADIMNRGCNGFIQKPFSIIDLSLQLRKVFGT